MAKTIQMQFTRRGFLGATGLAAAAGLAAGMAGCAQQSATPSASSTTTSASASSAASGSIDLDSAAWSYDSENDVYYQIGVQYCEKPQAPTYESMGIYVPGAYFDAKDNGNGTFTCTPSATGKVGNYTAATAPIVMPINTAGYSSQAAPTSYSSKGLADYLSAGFVYVYAGCRGRKMEDDACGAAPWGVTDLKAAVRTLRLNKGKIAGNTERIFSFGHSGGGAQSAVLGASGDASEYDDYLAEIGAPTKDADGKALTDAIFGAMCWCPITNLDVADAAYEWNMGQFQNSDTRAEGTFTRQLSLDLAAAFAEKVNAMGLVDAAGTALTLEAGGEGVFTAGTYYDYVKGQVEASLNNFLADTTWPYTPSSKFNADMGAGGGRGGSSGSDGGRSGGPSGAPSGKSSGSSSESSTSALSSGASSASSDASSGAPSDVPAGAPSDMPSGAAPGESGGSSAASNSSSTSYATAADYIAHLNEKTPWVVFDEAAGTATITGLVGFVNACKSASKSVGAFDAFDRSKAENEVFGNEYTQGLHYDAIMADLLEKNASAYAALSGWDASYPAAYTDDRKFIDAQGHDTDFRQDAYNPMYYVCASYKGAGTSTPAAHWRIRTGIEQGDTASTTEINLALALAANKDVADVDFATVWGQGHTTAERTGSSTDNFISWVNDCCK